MLCLGQRLESLPSRLLPYLLDSCPSSHRAPISDSSAVECPGVIRVGLARADEGADDPFEQADASPNGPSPAAAKEFSATSVTLRQLVETAYRRHGFDPRRVTGGPSWIETDRSDVTARAPAEHVFDEDGCPRQSSLMRQRLLIKGEPPGPSTRPPDTTRSIVEMLPEQLQLKLEETTGPVETLVIAAAEKP